MGFTAESAEVGKMTHIFCLNQKEQEWTAEEGSLDIRQKEEQMLKIRLQGTPKDIQWFRKILERDTRIQVNEFSEMFANKGTYRFFRVYAEIEKSEKSKRREAISRETSAERRARLEEEN